MRPFVVARSVRGQDPGLEVVHSCAEDVVAPPATRRSPNADWKTGLDVLLVVNGSMC